VRQWEYFCTSLEPLSLWDRVANPWRNGFCFGFLLVCHWSCIGQPPLFEYKTKVHPPEDLSMYGPDLIHVSGKPLFAFSNTTDNQRKTRIKRKMRKMRRKRIKAQNALNAQKTQLGFFSLSSSTRFVL